ncbi:phosphoserine phosphatase SerB [Colletotrichum graminicola]|uniref:phosphoserine phosphatase n=1 Tax=Colletotrichum graminicola (strain M1.001 / M2 / FGSC 10212) TaxID=645133 RepID=E3QPC9_COLGM|nr:phosphoserine phosphatase SerB [Colletotrichum graminicola M1.001]EFQ32717.1 phosphoserine phosphatase SerB [Colletotrichum graminicola M1.001]WDK18061.1 phosphoserine phosphatase SerB [Colletotrichum graminicola]
MADASPARSATSPRPQLSSSMRSSSFLREHQQYRPPQLPESRFGIDTVVEDLGKVAVSPSQQAHSYKQYAGFNGIPSEDNPPTIRHGLNHSYSHPNCAPAGGKKQSRLVATLFYKPNGESATAAAAATRSGGRVASPPKPTSEHSGGKESLPANFAPTQDPESFPLEPPTQEPEKLDHLYGSYVSPMCVTSFLHLMSTFPLPEGESDYSSSHRCLDSQDNPRVVELTLDPSPCQTYLSLTDLRRHELIYRFEREWSVDVALQPDTLWRHHPRLVVFDMDSTLITQEVIDLLAATIKDPPDLAARVADITHRAMLGELEFDAAFRERVQLLKGLPASFFEQLRPVLDVTKGVPRLIKALKRLGVKTAVLSGGFLPLTSWLAGELGIDYAHANEVVVDDAGRLTGEVKGLIVGKERKRDLLIEIAGKEGIDLSQVVAVGDGANDLLMMGAAGLGVAWNAKPMVQMEADTRLNSESLLDLLYLFGFTGDEIEQLAS